MRFNEDDENDYMGGRNGHDDEDDDGYGGMFSKTSFDIASKLGIKLPDLAPSVTNEPVTATSAALLPTHNKQQTRIEHKPIIDEIDEIEANSYGINKRKKYAKEAWPGRKPTLGGGTSATGGSGNDSFNLY